MLRKKKIAALAIMLGLSGVIVLAPPDSVIIDNSLEEEEE